MKKNMELMWEKISVQNWNENKVQNRKENMALMCKKIEVHT